MQETSQKNRTIMSIIAIVLGLIMAYIIPFMVQPFAGTLSPQCPYRRGFPPFLQRVATF
jgi:hypothetical protein